MNQLLDKYTSFHRIDAAGREFRTTTAFVRVVRNAHLVAAEWITDAAKGGLVAVICDPTTHEIQGQALIAALDRHGARYVLHIERPHAGHEHVSCDDATIADVQSWLAGQDVKLAVAIGAGTMNDVVKMAAFKCSVPYCVLGTAPSMNGYTSSIAAILSDGVKTTQPCDPPVAAFASPEIMANAPYRMIASGLGDLYSKPVSNADWRLSHRLLGTFHSDIVMELVEAGASLLDGVAPRLPSRDEDAVARLTSAIMLSGLAMQAAGTSGPASGGEHLISHYIDMTGYAYDQPRDFHGCQVAVGTVVTSALYERVRALEASTIDIDRLVEQHPEWPTHHETIKTRFGTLSDAVLEHASTMYPTRIEVRDRLTTLTANWTDIMSDVGQTLRTRADLEAELRSAECPTRFSEIGCTKERADRAVRHCKDIRARFTILHLASELGQLDDFVDEIISEQF